MHCGIYRFKYSQSVPASQPLRGPRNVSKAALQTATMADDLGEGGYIDAECSRHFEN